MLTHITTPRDGLPPLLDSARALLSAVDSLAAGSGPIAVDTERAADFRYDDRAYLVQLRRAGAGTFLVDPTVSAEANAAFGEVMNSAEWILHAAHTDLPCLSTLGWHPTRLHDTQIAGRILGLGQPGLGPMLERHFAISIDKDKGREDWSARPLSPDLLTYAALDVEFLPELHEETMEELRDIDRVEWYSQDCAAVLAQAAPIPTPEWTSMKGVSTLRSPRSLAIARALWTTRNEFALARDRSPERTIKRRDILRVAQYPTSALKELRDVRMPPALRKRALSAVQDALSLPDANLPAPTRRRSGGMPDHKHWESDYPRAYAVVEALTEATHDLAEQLEITPEAIATMKPLRKTAWALSQLDAAGDDPIAAYEDTLGSVMESEGARPWQIELIVSAALGKILEALA